MTDPSHLRPARLHRRRRALASLVASTERRLARCSPLPDVEDDLARARELLAEADPLVTTDPVAAAARIDEARDLAARSSRAAQENLDWTRPPPTLAERALAHELRELREPDGGEGVIGWLLDGLIGGGGD